MTDSPYSVPMHPDTYKAVQKEIHERENKQILAMLKKMTKGERLAHELEMKAYFKKMRKFDRLEKLAKKHGRV